MDETGPGGAEVMEFEFVKGHIAATMALVNGLIVQNVIDRTALDAYFTDFLSNLPHTRKTLALRLIIDQWRQGLYDGQADSRMRAHIFSVIEGGRGAAD